MVGPLTELMMRGENSIQRLAVTIYEAVFDVERPILSKLFQKALALRMLVVPVK
jgi:hypothetical protein